MEKCKEYGFKKNEPERRFRITKLAMVVGFFSLSALLTYASAENESLANSSPTVNQQSKKISGKVVDKSGIPIIGATVKIKGTNVGTITNKDGVFEFSTESSGKQLQVSYIGMKTLELSTGNGLNLTITMEDGNLGLDEVVVVGYGTQKKATVTGSISQVGGEELKKVAAVNLTNTLAGKTAGVIANNRSGEPGEDNSKITIRGKGTLGNTDALIVVDGVADRSFSRLNPEDIESISVLKDASAAIYGARAANGVILVTTKRGKEGAVKINYSGSVGVTQPTRVPKMLNSYQYATYINEYDRGHGLTETYPKNVITKLQDGSDLINYPSTDWWSEVAKDWATKTQHSLSVTGGNDKVSFYSSIQYASQDAIYKESAQNYSQYQFTSNVDAKIGKRMKFSMDILGRQEVRNRGTSETEYLFGKFLTTSPMAGAYYPNGLPRVGYDGVANNAALMVTNKPGSTKTKYNVLNLKPTLKLDLDQLTKGLYVEGYAALDFMFKTGKTLNTPYDVYLYNNATKEYENNRSGTGAISVNSWADNSSTVTLNGRLGYTRTFNEKHKIDAFIAYEQSRYDFSTVSAYRTNYISAAIPEIFAGSSVPKDKDNGGKSDATVRQNIFGRINYSFKDKYLAEITMRYDGSQNFAPGHRWGAFPGASVGWVISEENFFSSIKPIVSFLKLKGSWGLMGNDNIDAYQYLTQYAYGTSASDDVNAPGGATFGTDNSVNKTLKMVRTANPLVTWEKAQTINAGFSAQFFQGKFGLDFDYFKSMRHDILIRRNASVPAYTGLTLPVENFGKVNNQGIELVASYQDKSKDFTWGVTGNFTYAKNKVVYMDQAATTPEWQKTEGHPIDGFVIYEATGIYQTQAQVDNSPHLAGAKPGDLIYNDRNGDKKITWDDAYRTEETSTPQIVYGTTLNGSWKGLDLNIFFQGQALAKQIVQPSMNMVTDFYDGRWIDSNTPEQNANARWPKAFIKQTYGDARNGVASSWWLRDASFLRLKSIEIGYSLPKALLKSLGLEKIRIYANGNNLFSIDKMKICDPEMPDGVAGTNFYPQQRMLTGGINVTF
jgi:TonB-linked SusC/RagA family outer membrane protein